MADKEEIRQRTDILDLVQAFVPLKRRGRNWVGLCPFHAEKTGSFNVDPQTQTFKCFGCDASGDVFTFVMRYENMSFVEAAEFLARRAGLTFDRGPADAAKASERDQLFEINRVAADWFQKMLDRAPDARAYLQRRGLAHETIRHFQIGWAPEDWEALTSFLRSQRRDMLIAEKAGLIKRREDKSFFDMFRARTIFPILDEQGRIVGFGGRATGDEQPKYLNTGETPLFQKSKLLYGLSYARRKIASEGRVLLMEGYMDVIAAHQAGFENAVATLGTSLTEEHAKKLARLMPENPTAVLVYDADSAGIKATLRASEILEKEGIQVKVVRLPAGEDPDSLLKAGGIDVFQRAVDEAVGRVAYQLERTIATTDQSTDDGRSLLLRRIVHILASVPTRSERDVYVERVYRYHPLSAQGPGVAKEQLHKDAEAYAAQKSGVKPATPGPTTAKPPAGAADELRRREENYRRSDGGRRPARGDWRDRPRPIEPPPPSTGGPSIEERTELELLRAMAEPEWRPTVLKHIKEEDYASEEIRHFFRFVRDNSGELGDDASSLRSVLAAKEEDSFSSAILQRLQESHALLANVPITEAALRECAARLRRNRIKALQEELERFVQGRNLLTREDAERVQDLHRIIKQLKSP